MCSRGQHVLRGLTAGALAADRASSWPPGPLSAGAGSVWGGMDERRRLGVELVVDGRRVASETRYGEVGAYVLVLCTCVSDLGVELHSVYVGHPGTSTHVTHLALSGPPSQAASETAVYPEGDLPVVFARRRYLFDHLQRLQDELSGRGHQAGINLDDHCVSEFQQPRSVRPL